MFRSSSPIHHLLRACLLLALFVSACSSGGSGSAPSATTSAPSSGQPTSSTTAPKPTAGQQTSTPASAAQPAAQGAPTGQPEQRSSQAGGDAGPATEAPAAPIVARSRTTGRPITIEVWLTDWEQSTQQLFNDQLVPAFEAANPDIAVNVQYLDWRVFTEKLIAAHAGGVLPDVFQAGAEYVAPLATRGMALDISSNVASCRLIRYSSWLTGAKPLRRRKI